MAIQGCIPANIAKCPHPFCHPEAVRNATTGFAGKEQACCLLGGMVPRVDQNTVIHLGVYHVFACRTTYTNNMHPYECVLRV